MVLRGLVVLVSLSLLGGAGYLSWTGFGVADADTGAESVRAGSAGLGRATRLRVK